MTDNWYDDHANLALVARYMADDGDTVNDIIYLLEKPWKFDDTFKDANASTAGP